MCLDIPDPINGQIIFDPDTHSPFLFGTVASYSCFFDGENLIAFGLTGGNHTRTCDGDGSHYIGNWTGTAPTCESKMIPMQLSLAKNQFQSLIVYTRDY